MVLSLLPPPMSPPSTAPSRGGLRQGRRESLLSCRGAHLSDKPWCFAQGLLLACLSLGAELMWLKEQRRLQPPSLSVLSLGCRGPWLASRPARPSPVPSRLLPPNQEQGVNF